MLVMNDEVDGWEPASQTTQANKWYNADFNQTTDQSMTSLNGSSSGSSSNEIPKTTQSAVRFCWLTQPTSTPQFTADDAMV